jgi:hypothetical protein
MVEQHLAQLLPRFAFRSIEPYLSRTGQVLDRLSGSRLRARYRKREESQAKRHEVRPLRLEALFDAGAAAHLAEMPLSDDQR